MKLLVTCITLLITFSGWSQDRSYARSVLETLCSPEMDGRGYFNQGELRAAEYIRGQFEEIGLQKVEGDYFQSFNLSTNAIVGDLSCEIGKTILIPGEDFLVDPSSPDYDDKSKILVLEKKALTDLNTFKSVVRSFEDKFVLIDQTLIKDESKEVKSQLAEIVYFLKFSKEVRLNGIIEIVEKKLTYTASQKKAVRPHISVLKEKLPKNPNSINLKVDSDFKEKHQSQNVVGFLEGKNKEEYITVVAHYDHLGRMGKDVYFPGANDNASGVAMLLGLAKDLAKADELEYSMLFICFGAEEIGLVGSKYYTENPLLPLKKIKFLLNLDILGTGEDGIQIVNGKTFREEFDYLVETNEAKDLLKEVKIRGEACNSDHCFFTEKGVPSFFIYTLGGVQHYHDIYDRSETLPLTEYEDLFVLLRDFITSR